MPKKITGAAVPPITLTPQDEHELRQLSADLRQEVVSQYEEFLFKSRRGVDGSQWKLLRSDGDVHAYKERKPKVSPSPVYSDKHMHKPSQRRPQQDLAEQSHLPRVLVTGMVPGKLDGVMYGTSYHDTQSYDAFWVAQGDRIEESAVLATLDSATVEDPYRFLGVVWFMRTFPLNVIQHRDCLALEDTYTTRLRNGERVGVSICHSIQHRDLAELREFKTVRATTSYLSIFRQYDTHRVESFTIHFLDTKGCVPDKHHLMESLKSTLSIPELLVGIGLRKKLQWLMRRRDLDRQAASAGDAIEPTSSGSSEHCEVCDKTLGTLFSCPGTSCQLCFERVCFKCSISQDLVVATSATKSTTRAHDFCVGCLLKAKATSTLQVAQQDVVDRFKSGQKQRRRVRTTLMSADAGETNV